MNNRNYTGWSSERSSSGKQLNERPHITNSVLSAQGEKRYYSSVDAEIYFGDMFIDEVTSIEWAVQQQTMPIYGYNSYCFDDLAVGSRIIQGQFAVNFTKAGFLLEIQNDKQLPRISRKLYGVDNKVNSYFSDEFRKRLNMPLWDGGFDIVVGFGDHNKSVKDLSNSIYKTYLVLDCCQITGSMVQLDYNGIPVQEIYTFMARDIKYTPATDSEKAPIESEKPSVARPGLKLTGTFDVSSNECIVKLVNMDKTKLSNAKANIITSLSNQSLKTMMTLNSNADGELITTLSKDKTKALLDEINREKLTKLNVQVVVQYYDGTGTSFNSGLKTETKHLDFQIKIS